MRYRGVVWLVCWPTSYTLKRRPIHQVLLRIVVDRTHTYVQTTRFRHAIQVEELRKEEEPDIKVGSCRFSREGSHQEPANEVSLSIALTSNRRGIWFLTLPKYCHYSP